MKKYKFQNGGFSDDFYRALQTAQTNQYEENNNDYEDNNQEDRFSALEEEINQLKELLSQYQNQPQPIYNEPQQQDDSGGMDIINMVLNDDNEGTFYDQPQEYSNSLGWLKRKDNTVNIDNTSSALSEYINSLPDNLKYKLVATSGNDYGGHVEGSKHYNNEAIDLRYDDEVYNYMLNDPHLKQSGLKLLNPNHGTAKHLHLQTN